jgi:hypothetical protein
MMHLISICVLYVFKIASREVDILKILIEVMDKDTVVDDHMGRF